MISVNHLKPRRRLSCFPIGIGLSLVLAIVSGVAAAEEEGQNAPGGNSAPENAPGFWERDTLTGDWGGTRADLEDLGVVLAGAYTADGLGNPSGGIRQRGVYTGLLELDADVDFDKLAGIAGTSFHASALQFQGRGLSSHFIGNFMTARNSETAPSTRLWALWFQQTMLDGLVSVKVGQTPQDEEFMTSTYGSYFTNATFGWPAGFSANIPGGGGVYPMAVTGGRVKVAPSENWAWLLGVFNGEPAVGLKSGEDPTRLNSDGLNFNLSKPPMIMSEVQWTTGKGDDSGLPPSTVKLGGWYHAGAFSDLHYDTNGVSLSNSASNGVARSDRGNWDVYGVIETMPYRAEGSEDKGLGAFIRFSVCDPAVSTLPYYGEVGLTYKGLPMGRNDDVVGIALAYGGISGDLQARQQDDRVLNGSTAVVQDSETLIEFIYRAQVAPWWIVAPDIQYVIHPGGGAGMPDNGAQRIPDAAILGLRTILKL